MLLDRRLVLTTALDYQTSSSIRFATFAFSLGNKSYRNVQSKYSCVNFRQAYASNSVRPTYAFFKKRRICTKMSERIMRWLIYDCYFFLPKFVGNIGLRCMTQSCVRKMCIVRVISELETKRGHGILSMLTVTGRHLF